MAGQAAQWRELDGAWVLIPANPLGLIHFLGGAFVGAAPQLTYRWLLERLADRGYGTIATPFVNSGFDHEAIAEDVLIRFDRAVDWLYRHGQLRRRSIPVYGLGHSMGCKLHLLIGSIFEVERAGNALMAFNNYSAQRAIPLFDRFGPVLESINRAVPGAIPADVFDKQLNAEFTPSPAETEQLIASQYGIRRNLLVRFGTDDLDQSARLAPILQRRFPGWLALQDLPGNHLTPLGQDVTWQVGGAFSPLDAIGQWAKQEFFYRDLNRLSQELLRWLDPLGPT
jgi:hypothetical protein